MLMKSVATNPKARHDYFLEDRYEAGVSLTGGEVKSIRAGNVSLKEAFVSLRRGEAYLMGAYIKPYNQAADAASADPTRPRKLLLHRTELSKLVGVGQGSGRTIVPTKLYFKQGLLKLEIAVAQGKKQYDKRHDLKKRQAKREADQAVRQSQR